MFKKITNAFKNGKDQKYKEDIISFVLEEFNKRQKERLPFELQWRINMEFYEGNQYQQVNSRTNNIEEISKLYWYQEREVFNQIAPIVETRLAKLGRLRPIPRVRPATDSDEDISAAKVSTKLLESTYYNQKMKEKQLTANVWSEFTGTAIYKAMWNPKKGRSVGAIATIDNDMENTVEVHEGDVETIVISPYEIYPDSIWNQEVENCKSIIHAKAYHVNDIKDMWDIDVNPGEVNVFTVKSNNVGTGGLGSGGQGSRVAVQKKKNSAIVYEYWEKPSSQYKNGRLIISTDNELLYMGDLPYKVDENSCHGLPFKTQKSILKPSCFFGKSVVERIIPLQRRYNSLKNRKAEYLNRAAIGQIVAEEGSIDLDYLESEGAAPGAIIEVQVGRRFPQYVQFHALPSTFETEEQNILQDFVRISGVSEISRDSNAPVGANSGVALTILQENDDTRLSLTASYTIGTAIEIAKFWLRLYKQFANGPRILRSIGKDNTVQMMEWDNSTITSDDVYIEAHSQTIESTAQRRQRVFDLFNMGLFNDPDTGRPTKEGLSRIFEMIELGNWENGDNDIELHKNKADRENKSMIQGQMLKAVYYDDDIMHIQRHNRFRLTVEYEELISENPELEQIIESHIQMHIQAIQSKAAPQQQEPQQIQQQM